jgi:hypothetical protein
MTTTTTEKPTDNGELASASGSGSGGEGEEEEAEFYFPDELQTILVKLQQKLLDHLLLSSVQTALVFDTDDNAEAKKTIVSQKQEQKQAKEQQVREQFRLLKLQYPKQTLLYIPEYPKKPSGGYRFHREGRCQNRSDKFEGIDRFFPITERARYEKKYKACGKCCSKL